MAIAATCSDCGRSYKLDDRLAGRRAKCKACGGVVEIPAASGSAPADIGFQPNPQIAKATAPRTSSSRKPALNVPPPPRVAPPPADPMASPFDDPGMASFNDLAALESTGQPSQHAPPTHQYVPMPPPAPIQPAYQPQYASRAGTTIAQADPEVAKAYNKKMSRRAAIASGASGGIGVTVYILIKILGTGARAYNRTQNNQDNSRSTSGGYRR